MILQGLYNILSLYFENELYNSIDNYFRERINSICWSKEEMECISEDFLTFISLKLREWGFEREKIENKFLDPYLKINSAEKKSINSSIELYDTKIAPLIHELFLEKFVDYLVDENVASLMVNLKANGYLPIEFIVELKRLKMQIDNSEKIENLRKYIHIRDNIIKKFLNENKKKIEDLEDLEEPLDKLQLMYLIFRVIDFFHLEKLFDFSHIITYLKNNVEEWLESLPLISLKNPDLYYCGLYLAKHLNIEIDEEKVKEFLKNLYNENIDEFESPIIEATDRVYYYFKSTSMIKFRLSDEQVIELVHADAKFFEPSYLKQLETSQLVVILKIYNVLGLYKKVNSHYIDAIINEIEKRITPEGIKQNREGFISSEASYYVLFCSYMRNALERLKDYDLLGSIVTRIYRNLEILDFSIDMNHDLVSELFYSLESLKLLNCIETKEMIIHLAKFLFPQEVVDKISKSETIAQTGARFRHFKVNRITGETMY